MRRFRFAVPLVSSSTRSKSAILATFAWAVTIAGLALQPVTARGTVEATIEGDPLVRLLPAEGIPAIDDPRMVPAAESGLRDSDPVIGVVEGSHARAYPTWILDGHEIVNDRLGERPIAATW